MANLQGIKHRIGSTKKTRQITNAMYMVSSSKLNQILRYTSKYLDYANHVEDIIAHLSQGNFLKQKEKSSIPFLAKRKVNKTALLVITSDRGLVGSYNNQVLKKTDRLISKNNLTPKNTLIFSIGSKGTDYYRKKGFKIAFQNLAIGDVPKFWEVFDLVKEITKEYSSYQFDALKIVYSHNVNRLVNRVIIKDLLPIDENNFKKDKKGKLINNKYTNANVDYDFEPSPQSLLKSILPQYVRSLLYGIILDSKTSEHSSSVTAMQSATDNADDMVSSLNLRYNRARQAAITTEITEITGGQAALQ